MKISRRLLLIAAACSISLAHGYSHTPLPLGELARLSACSVEGLAETQSVVQRGAGFFTTTTFSVTRAAGDCAPGARIEVETYGGMLPDGTGVRIAGIEDIRPGARYLLLLQRGRTQWEPVEGPQGVVILEPAGSGKVSARDAAGVRLEGPGFAKHAGHAHGVGKALPVDGDELFLYVADKAGSHDAAAKAALRASIEKRLRGASPGVPAAPRRGEGPAAPDTSLPKYSHISATGNAWNVPPSLDAGLRSLVFESMVRWNLYAVTFFVFNPHAEGFGPNGRNDVGGFQDSNTLNALYARPWNSGEVGLMFFRCNPACDSDVYLNPARTWSYFDDDVQWGRVGALSIYEVMTHELGHGMGLGHSTGLAVMGACVGWLGWRPWLDDIEGIRTRWPARVAYNAQADFRLRSAGSSFGCAGSSQVGASATSFSYNHSQRRLAFGNFTLLNAHSAPVGPLKVRWIVRRPCAFFDLSCTPEVNVFDTDLGMQAPGQRELGGGSFVLPGNMEGLYEISADLMLSDTVLVSEAPRWEIVVGSPDQVGMPVDFHVPEMAGFVDVPVRRYGPSSGPLQVTLATQDATAVANVDYTPVSASITFAAGELGQRFLRVPLLGSAAARTGDRAFNVAITGRSDNAVLVDDRTSVKIIDDAVDRFPSAGCAMPAAWTNVTGTWDVTRATSSEGRCSLASERLDSNGASEIRFVGDFTAGTVRFDRFVSTDASCYAFLIDEVIQWRTGDFGLGCGIPFGDPIGARGTYGWVTHEVPITAGRHTLTWRVRNGSPGAATERVYLDNVSIPLAPSGGTADVSVTQALGSSPVAGRDVVLTMTAANAGAATATGVLVTLPIPAGTTHVWNSPACVFASGTVSCSAAALAPGGSAAFRVVLRPVSSGSRASVASVFADQPDHATANNTSSITLVVGSAPPAVPISRYRLYSPVTLEHHFTTDLNEYNTLGTYIGTWQQEGAVGKVLDNPGSFNGVSAVPYYRLYDNSVRWHHWTTDPNEYYTLIQFPWWSAEGVDGYILPTAAPGAIQLYRLLFPGIPGLHHWTIDAYEYSVLTTQYGWIGEGGAGFVIP